MLRRYKDVFTAASSVVVVKAEERNRQTID